MSFGSRLKQARNGKQWTQNQVADKLGIDFTTISKYENDRSQPDNDVLRELADIYEVSIDWLLTGEKKGNVGAENRLLVNGAEEPLTDEEAKHLLDSLEMFRLLKAKRLKDRRGQDAYGDRDGAK
ncbi:helix-turn-helix domain-containing protein [Cohnella thailandensis]|uniref:Helix-turn-helix transcriptional regulator n=1 Tax=Cohnella thailandensis TaxID=557557 RepID=A0A841SNT4_9BACL|nr:helix-turn-helix transcriptional regulator [Cohnella thailandensis]MBB6633604.1 helix-turn-helix transcriptional regulator [Cohnella thailandensis]MBP1974624.1 transcriptional regulator with XRE-family HTH domain [Cohnella thailandensis]